MCTRHCAFGRCGVAAATSAVADLDELPPLEPEEYDEQRYQRLAALPLVKLTTAEALWLARALEFRSRSGLSVNDADR
jgi:hypothetical protein